MKHKQFIEVQLPKKTDAFKAMDSLKSIPGIIKASPITGQSVRIYYDRRKADVQSIVTHTGGFFSSEQL